MIIVCFKLNLRLKILNGMKNILNADCGMKIIKNKTKAMVCNKRDLKNLNIRIDNEEILEVKDLCYLGRKIT